jgi:hypothetical protein
MGEAARFLPPPAEAPSPAAEIGTPLTLAERIALLRPPCFWPALPGKALLTDAERIGLIRMADSVPGASGDETMVAFIEAMRHAPVGDVVEVGSGGGRLAMLLVWLARRYQIGPVLCLDAWSDEALAEFEIALAPLADGRLNYLRGGAVACYGPDLVVSSKTFGETRYEGRIALLHLARVEPDADAWTSHVVPGGWIVFGAGVRDTVSPTQSERIGARFIAGDAIFVQLKR